MPNVTFAGALQASWWVGTGEPQVTLGAEGDIYLDAAAIATYRLVDGTWVSQDVAAGGGGGSSPLTTKGDIYTRSSSADARLAVGTNGYALIADSTATTGLNWYNLPALASAVSSILSNGVFDGDSAGGDLTGNYPNPTLVTSGVSAGTVGSATRVPVIAHDAKGRATSATDTPIVLVGAVANAWGIFGSGVDGSAVLDGVNTFPWATITSGTYRLLRGVSLSSLQVDTGVRLDLNMQVACVYGNTLNNGSIGCWGNNASGSTAGASRGGVFYGAGTAGTAGSTTGAPSTPTSTSNTLCGPGGAGGSSPSGSGAPGGGVTEPANTVGGIPVAESVVAAMTARAGSTVLNAAPGGGGGRGDGSGTGGGGGGGAGFGSLFSNTISGSGTFEFPGGNGGSPAAANVNGGGGGGGGGGDGRLGTTTPNAASVWSCSAPGGVAGTGKGTGTNGTNGSPGRITIYQFGS